MEKQKNYISKNTNKTSLKTPSTKPLLILQEIFKYTRKYKHNIKPLKIKINTRY